MSNVQRMSYIAERREEEKERRRAEILDAARRLCGGTEDDFRACLYAPEMRDPDLIIRTGGERRLSNFLLWQSAYAELVFTPVMWPDFNASDLGAAVAEFHSRERRFGAVPAIQPRS